MGGYFLRERLPEVRGAVFFLYRRETRFHYPAIFFLNLEKKFWQGGSGFFLFLLVFLKGVLRKVVFFDG